MLVQRTSCASQQHIFVCEESMTWILRDRFNSCFYLPATWALFKGVSKEIRNFTGIPFIHSVIGPENSHRLLNQIQK